MTIALICNHFPPAIDGVGDYSFQLARALASSGVSVQIICRTQKETVRMPDVPVHAFVSRWDAANGKKLCLLLDDIKPDWVGIQYVPYGFHRRGIPLGLPALVRKIRKKERRVFLMFHEVSVRIHTFPSLLIGSAQKWIARKLCENSDAVFTSIELYARLLGRYAALAHIVPVGANVYLKPLSETEILNLRRRFAPEQGILICSFGNRDLQMLLQAIQMLIPEYPLLRLLICGHNTSAFDRDQFPFIHRSGRLPAEELGALLQVGDIFILPDPVSAGGHGGSSNKSGALAAACAAGQAIVGIRGNLNNRLLEHGRNIILVDGRNPTALASAVKTLIENPALRSNLKKQSRLLYQQHLSWERIAQAYLAVLKTA